MRIAIVEDEKEVAAHLTEMLKLYSKKYEIDIEVVHFPNGVLFLDKYRSDFDIVLMDIELPDMNGMRVAAKLRENDGNVVIIFVTNMAQYAIKGYEVGAFDFIVKPVIYNHLCQVLNRAKKLVKLEHDVPKLRLNKKDGQVVIRVPDILYVEIIGHTLYYHVGDKSIEQTGRISTAEESLSRYGFARCHNAYLVNLRFVESVEGYVVNVKGNSLPISRHRRKEFMCALAQFINGD